MLETPWLLFVTTSLAPITTPGQDMLLVMSRSLAHGPRAGVAFLPQFVSHTSQHGTLMLFALGGVFAALTFAVKGAMGLSSGLPSSWQRSRPKVLSWIYRSSGSVLMALGLRLALERRQ